MSDSTASTFATPPWIDVLYLLGGLLHDLPENESVKDGVTWASNALSRPTGIPPEVFVKAMHRSAAQDHLGGKIIPDPSKVYGLAVRTPDLYGMATPLRELDKDVALSGRLWRELRRRVPYLTRPSAPSPTTTAGQRKGRRKAPSGVGPQT